MNFDDLFPHSSFWGAQLVKNTPTGEFIIYVQHHQPIGSEAHNSSRTTIHETKENLPKSFDISFLRDAAIFFRHFRYIITNQRRSEVSRSFLIASRRPTILISALWKLRQCRAAFTIGNFFFPIENITSLIVLIGPFSLYSSDYRCNLYTLPIRYYIERKRKLPLLFRSFSTCWERLLLGPIILAPVCVPYI